MVTLESINFGSGSVTYVPEVEARPASKTTEKNGNVTINNITEATPGVPAHYEVSFMLSSKFENEGHKFSNIFHWSCVVPEPSDRASYRKVEDGAARMIAPMLRLLADKIEADLPNFDEAGEESSEKGP